MNPKRRSTEMALIIGCVSWFINETVKFVGLLTLVLSIEATTCTLNKTYEINFLRSKNIKNAAKLTKQYFYKTEVFQFCIKRYT